MHLKLDGSEVQNQEVAYCSFALNWGSCRPCIQLSKLTSARVQVYSCSCDKPSQVMLETEILTTEPKCGHCPRVLA